MIAFNAFARLRIERTKIVGIWNILDKTRNNYTSLDFFLSGEGYSIVQKEKMLKKRLHCGIINTKKICGITEWYSTRSYSNLFIFFFIAKSHVYNTDIVLQIIVNVVISQNIKSAPLHCVHFKTKQQKKKKT